MQPKTSDTDPWERNFPNLFTKATPEPAENYGYIYKVISANKRPGDQWLPRVINHLRKCNFFLPPPYLIKYFSCVSILTYICLFKLHIYVQFQQLWFYFYIIVLYCIYQMRQKCIKRRNKLSQIIAICSNAIIYFFIKQTPHTQMCK